MKKNSWNLSILLVILSSLLQINGIRILIPHYIVNATVKGNAILAVDCRCNQTLSIKWKHLSLWGVTSIIIWKPGTNQNISKSYENRIQVYRNGSIQLLNVDLCDAGSYVVTVTDKGGSSKDGVIILNINEPVYKDLHFVAVIVTVLVTISTVLMFILWICNQSVKLYKIKRRVQNTNSSTHIEGTSL